MLANGEVNLRGGTLSIKALNWAWEQPTSSSGQKLVLLALADHANDDGHCWPGMKRIADKCDMSARQVSTHVTNLEKAGILTTNRRMKDNNQYSTYDYQLNFASGSLLPVEADFQRNSTSGGQQKPTSGGLAEADFRTEPSVSNRKKEPSVSSSSDDDAFQQFWQTYPRKVGKDAARTALKRALKKTDLETILTGLHLYNLTRPKETQFVVHPTTWLNQGRWADEPDQPPQPEKPLAPSRPVQYCGNCWNGWIELADDTLTPCPCTHP